MYKYSKSVIIYRGDGGGAIAAGNKIHVVKGNITQQVRTNGVPKRWVQGQRRRGSMSENKIWGPR